MATISCRCGAVELKFPVDKELFRHECCCHDCNSALWYAAQNGGPADPVDHCADCCWLPNDFEITRGTGNIGAFMNYAGADTTRFYCTDCWTLLFGIHPIYEEQIVVSQVCAGDEFNGLGNVERMAPQARHFLTDLDESQRARLRPWPGDPARVYEGPAEVLLESFPAMKAAGGKGALMNAGVLLEQVGPVLIPDDAPRLSSGPPSYAQQTAAQEQDN